MILENIRLARAVDETDLSDLTSARQTEPAYWAPEAVDMLVIPMEPEPTAAEAVAIRRRLVTADAAEEQHLRDLLAAAKDSSAPAWAKATIRAELARYGEHVP